MEPAKIDWNNLDSVFIVDQVYENINAPQFVDFLSSTSPQPDDVAWFCRSGTLLLLFSHSILFPLSQF